MKRLLFVMGIVGAVAWVVMSCGPLEGIEELIPVEMPVPGMVLIPAGTFMMGSPTTELGRGSDETQHMVRISKAFYLGKYEVTQKEYYDLMGSWPDPDTAPSSS
jgi:hypothetical protein